MIARAAFQLERRAIGDQPAGSDHQRTGADCADFLEDMRGNDDDLVGRQILDQLAHLMLLVRVEAVGGLVEDQRARIVEDRLGQADAALEALGKGLDGLAEDMLQLHLADRPVDPLPLFGTAKATDLGDELEEAAHRHVAITGGTFRQVADLPLGFQGLGMDIEAEDARSAGGRRQEAGEHLHGGGLTRTVGAEETQDFSRCDAEGQVVHGSVLRKTLGQIGYFDHGL
ncbi:hypothetical protein D3C81_1358990 [compost metagenome]